MAPSGHEAAALRDVVDLVGRHVELWPRTVT